MNKRRQRKQREPDNDADNQKYREEDDGGVDGTEGLEAGEEVKETDASLDTAYEEEEERSGDDELEAQEDDERERGEEEEEKQGEREEEEERQREEWERRRMEMERGRLGGHREEEEGGASYPYPPHFYLKVPSLVTRWSHQQKHEARYKRQVPPSHLTGSTGGARRAWSKGAHTLHVSHISSSSSLKSCRLLWHLFQSRLSVVSVIIGYAGSHSTPVSLGGFSEGFSESHI